MREITFEHYLAENQLKGIIDFSLRANASEKGITFYLHPANRDGETPDFEVRGNVLTQIQHEPMAAPKLQRFKCHKEVEAMKIKRVDGGPETYVLCGDLMDVTVTKEWVEKFKPRWGGYFLRYADGYTSFSPQEAFETGYQLLEDGK